ncbi:Crp/Fnr family transcriptional regulator [Streptomyces sp. NPDC047072]|uniref:Crp/Fnr family transcriptional regulator n=1 Tax=Streptomyces sp. NPDC047072 TaxID=3154809 RepID=UPI0034040597
MPDDSGPSKSLEQLAALEQVGSRLQFRSGQVIVREGEPSNHVVMLLSGSAKVVRQSGVGTEVILGLRQAPEFIGEMAALSGAPRSATVIAQTDVTAVAVPADRFKAFLAEHPDVALAVMTVMTDRLREADQARQALATQTVTQRVAARLLELAGRIGVVEDSTGDVRMELSQQDLAAWVGASREAVVRTLRMLKERDVVATERRQIVIKNFEVLRFWAAGQP